MQQQENDPVMQAWHDAMHTKGLDYPKEIQKQQGVMEEIGNMLLEEVPMATPRAPGRQMDSDVLSPAESSGSGAAMVVYDVEHALEALEMLCQENGLSANETKRVHRMLRRFMSQGEEQRRKMVEREAGLTTELRQKEQEIKHFKETCEEMKAIVMEKKNAVRTLQNEKDALASENRMLQSSLQYAKQKEKAAVEACRQSGAQVEDVKRRAAMKIEAAQKRLQELEVQMHVAGYAVQHTAGTQDNDDTESVDTVKEAYDIVHQNTLGQKDFSSTLVRIEGNSQNQNSIGGGEVAKAEKLFKSELATMQRRVEKSNIMLLKTSKAAEKLQQKLAEERRKVAALQEERTQLHSQILHLQQQPKGMDSKQVGSLINELAAARSKVDRLSEERSRLASELSSLKFQMNDSAIQQSENLAKAEEEAQKALQHEQQRCEMLQNEVSQLVSQLEDSTKNAADLEATRLALQESQERCAELAGSLELEQANAYERSIEVERLAQAAQACASELMEVREALEQEKIKVQHLIQEKAGLEGRMEAFSEALSSQEHNSEIMESLAEGRAMLLSKLRQAEADRDTYKAKIEQMEKKIQSTEQYVYELENTVDQLNEDISSVEDSKSELHAAAKATREELEAALKIHHETKSQLQVTLRDLDIARREVSALQESLEEKADHVSQLEKTLGESRSSLHAMHEKHLSTVEENNNLCKELTKSQLRTESLTLETQRLQNMLEQSYEKASSLETALKAAEAQCDALRRANSTAHVESMTMIDSMSEMTGLIDSINSLQLKIKELQANLASSQRKSSTIEAERNTLLNEVRLYENQLQGIQTEMTSVRNMYDEENARYSQAQRKVDTLTCHLEGVRKELEAASSERDELQKQVIDLLARDASNLSEKDSLQEEIRQLNCMLDSSNNKILELQEKLDGFKAEQVTWSATEKELKSKLERSEQLRIATEGRLVIVQNKAKTLEEATKQVDVLANDFEKLSEEHSILIQKTGTERAHHQKLEQEHASAKERISEMEADMESHIRTIATLHEALDSLRSELMSSKEAEKELQERVQCLAMLEPQVALLKEHLQEGGSWCETAASTLSARAEEVQRALNEAASARMDAMSLSDQLSKAQERAVAAETALKIAQEEKTDSESARQVSESALRLMKEEIRSLREQHREMAEVVQAVRDAEEETESKYQQSQSELKDAQDYLRKLQNDLADQRSTSSSLELLLQERQRQLEKCLIEITEHKERSDSLTVALESAKIRIAEMESKSEMLCTSTEELRGSLQDATKAISEKQSIIDTLHQELFDARSQATAESRAVKIMEDQIVYMQKELDTLQEAVSKDKDVCARVQELIDLSGEERSGLQTQIIKLGEQIDALENELSESKNGEREANNRCIKMEDELKTAACEKQKLLEQISTLERDIAVLEVVKDQHEREVIAERDDATRIRLHCKEVEGEVAKLRLDNQMLSQSFAAKMASLTPLVLSIEETLASVVGNKAATETNLIDLPTKTEDIDFSKTLGGIQVLSSRLVDKLSKLETERAAHASAYDSWNRHKRAFKSVAKLSISIALDNVSGNDESSILCARLKSDSEIPNLMEDAGLDNIWNALMKLSESKSGLKHAEKTRLLKASLEESKFKLNQANTKIAEQSRLREKMDESIAAAYNSVTSMLSSLELVTGDKIEILKDVDNTASGVDKLLYYTAKLKDAMAILQRKYRSMARTVNSVKKLAPSSNMINISKYTWDENDLPVGERKSSDATVNDRIPAIMNNR